MEKNSIIARNILGCFCGIAAFIGAQFLLIFIMSWIVKIPFVLRIFSWPSTPVLWTSAIINDGSLLLAFCSCYPICLPSQTGRKIGFIVLCGVLSVFGIAASILQLINEGFNDVLWSYIIFVVTSASFFVSAIRNKEDLLG